MLHVLGEFCCPTGQDSDAPVASEADWRARVIEALLDLETVGEVEPLAGMPVGVNSG